MRIAILETGAPPPALRFRHGGYPAMFERLLAPLSPQFAFFTARIFEGDAPPPLAAFDAALITGSSAGVYEDHDWIAPLEDFIRGAAAAGRPQVGLCFGHQIMAQAFGGRVEKAAAGWGVGVHRYRVSGGADWMAPAVGEIACAVSHQDQVTAPPPGARRLAGSEFCPNGALSYAQGPAISFQMHPEFAHDFAADLLGARRDRIAAELVETGLASLKGPTDRMVLGRWIANFILSA